jgi:DNA-binding NarL/FixJ family response regulator
MNQRSDYCVLVVDDHHMVRLGLKSFTQITSSFTVRWLEASSLFDAMEMFRKHIEIDLVLLDLNLPDSKGLKSVQQFLVEFPKARLVVHSATEDEFVVRQALALGVTGFIPKSSSADSMLTLLESLLVNARDMPDYCRKGSLSPQRSTHGSSVALNLQAHESGLNLTQIRVLELVLAGLNNKEIAAESKLALGTVKNTVSSIMLALEVDSRSHLISMFR